MHILYFVPGGELLIVKKINNINNTDKKKYRVINDIFISAFVIIFMFYIIIYPEKSINFVIKALNLCYLIIIPAVFPFLIISRMFLNSPIFVITGKLLSKPAKFLFNIQGEYTNAFLLGSIAGFPIGAKSVGEIYAEKPHTKNQAERTLAFCNNCSAPFVVAAAGIAVFGSAGIGFILFFTQLVSALVTGIIIRFLFKDTLSVSSSANTTDKKNTSDLPSIISDAVNGILNICGIIIFFYIIINILFEIIGAMPFIADNPVLYNSVKIAAAGFLEISSGIYILTNMNLPVSQKLMIVSAVFAWSGISVHYQIMYVLKNTGLSLKPYFTGKLIHVIISSILIKILLSINITAQIYQTAYAPSMITANTYDNEIAALILTGIFSGGSILIIVFAALFFRIYEAGKKSKNTT